MSFKNVGLRWSPASFPAYLATQTRPSWAKSVTMHYTASPSLAQRPNGFTAQHIENIASYYRETKGWSTGPHFFTDDDDIFGMTPPTEKGTHARSFNGTSLGTEALGLFDRGCEDPTTGRGQAVMLTTASCLRAQLDWLGLKPSRETLLFHRFDPRTTKTCPGNLVLYDRMLELVIAAKPGTLLPTAEPDTGGLSTLKTVPIVAWLVEKAGKTYAEVSKMLRQDGEMFYIGESWLEGAYYDKVAGATVAPESEAQEALDWILAVKPQLAGNVGVAETMALRLKIPYAEAARRVGHNGAAFLWDGKVIPGAFYDKTRQATMATSAVVSKL